MFNKAALSSYKFPSANVITLFQVPSQLNPTVVFHVLRIKLITEILSEIILQKVSRAKQP